jgi:hypothetical protein
MAMMISAMLILPGDDFPAPVTWLGVSIIVGSGIYMFHRESRLSQKSG